jgi:putative spermidine/putrescine transport system permease protein
MAQATMADSVIRAADGTPLKTRLRQAERLKRITAFGLVLPLLAFIVITFAVPIGEMLFRSVDNDLVGRILPKTIAALDNWHGEGVPDEAVFAALAEEMKIGRKERTIGRVGTRLNYEYTGARSLINKTGRALRKAKDVTSYKDLFLKTDKRWSDPVFWAVLKRAGQPYTLSYYLAALDMQYDAQGAIVPQPETEQIYVTLFLRTLWVSLLITVICIVLAYPIAFLMATLPTRISNLLMIMVLLPFWTSLLVRTTSWIVLLQSEGVLNDILVWLGVVGEDGRLQMIYNMTGTIIAMVHILLPFMVLPLFSVMKTISPSYMRAARSLGGTPFHAFWKVYFPQTVPGIGAGSILVFILAIGYYITPALVGGRTGQLISNFIAFHMQSSLNWGLAAALGGILLAGVLVLYLIYNRLVGIDNMKLG